VVAQQLQIALDAQAVAQGLEPIDHVDSTTHKIAVHVTSTNISGGAPYGVNGAPADQAFELDITPTNTLSGVGNSGSFTIAETSGTFTLTLQHGGMNATTSALAVGASAGVVQAAIGVLLAALGVTGTTATVTKTNGTYAIALSGGGATIGDLSVNVILTGTPRSPARRAPTTSPPACRRRSGRRWPRPASASSRP
jgi:hypothetical protein